MASVETKSADKGNVIRQILVCLLMFVLVVAAIVFCALYFIKYGEENGDNDSPELNGSGPTDPGTTVDTPVNPGPPVDPGTQVDPEKKGKVCISAACVDIASTFLSRMDNSVDPCKDFYQYACGNYMQQTLIPSRGYTSTTDDVADNVMFKIKVMLEKKYDRELSKPEQDAVNTYASCMDTDTIETLGKQVIEDMLNEYGGWPVANPSWDENTFDILETLAKLESIQNSLRLLMPVYVYADPENSSQNAIHFMAGRLAIFPTLHYLGDRNSSILKAYEEYAIQTAIYMGADPATAETDMKAVVDFEVEYAKAQLTVPERIATKKNVRLTISELYSNVTNNIDWLKYLNIMFADIGVTLANDQEVIIDQFDYYTKVTELVSNANKRTVANYLLLRLLVQYDITFPAELRAIKLKFDQVAKGKLTQPQRWKECAEHIYFRLEWPVGRLYIEEYYDIASKAKTDEMISHFSKSLLSKLDDVEWMGKSSRSLAQDKVNKMRKHIGFPVNILDNAHLEALHPKLQTDKGTFLANFRSSDLRSSTFVLQAYGKEIDKSEWILSPSVFGAFYHFSSNTIIFPAAFFQEHLFNKNYPSYVNFGSSGWAVGHEMIHAFDAIGRMSDAEGNVGNWWTPTDSENFKNISKCFEDQYSEYYIESLGKNVNGLAALNENMADSGGMILAYDAYQSWLKENNIAEELMLPGLNLTPEQLFFLSFAQTRCQKNSVQRDQLLYGSVYSPGRYRVIGTLHNIDSFVKAFNCDKTSYMAAEKTCKLF